MFDVGFWELVILFGLGLIILGPERLPKVAVQIGNWAGQARRMARSLTSQIRDELDLNQTYTPPSAAPEDYHRPGMDDLKPGDGDEENTIHDEPDDRDHSDAGAAEYPPGSPDHSVADAAGTESHADTEADGPSSGTRVHAEPGPNDFAAHDHADAGADEAENGTPRHGAS